MCQTNRLLLLLLLSCLLAACFVRLSETGWGTPVCPPSLKKASPQAPSSAPIPLPNVGPVPSPRTLVLMVESRELAPLNMTADPTSKPKAGSYPPRFSDSPYWTQTAVINAEYAARHGYDFLYATLDPLDPLRLPLALRPNASDPKDPWSRDSKMNPACYNSRFQAVRASSWCKVLIAWAVADEYDLVLLLDSDAFITGGDQSVNAILTPGHKNVMWGAPPNVAGLVFVTNFYHSPTDREGSLAMVSAANAGTFVVRKAGQGRQLLQTWWNVHETPMKHAFEQDALWKVLSAGSYVRKGNAKVQIGDPKYFLSNATLCNLDEYPMGACRECGGGIESLHSLTLTLHPCIAIGWEYKAPDEHRRWLLHVSSFSPELRERWFAQALFVMGHTRRSYKAAVARLITISTKRFDSIGLDAALQARVQVPSKG